MIDWITSNKDSILFYITVVGIVLNWLPAIIKKIRGLNDGIKHAPPGAKISGGNNIRGRICLACNKFKCDNCAGCSCDWDNLDLFRDGEQKGGDEKRESE